MSVKKKIGIIFLVIFSLPVFWALVVSVKQGFATHSAKHKVNVARMNIESKTDEKISLFTSVLKNSKVVSSQIASSKVDACYVTHEDSGWFARNWYQDCYLRYVNGYITNFSRNALKEKLSSSPEVLAGIGSLSNMDNFYPDTCELSADSTKMKLSYIPSGTQKSTDSSCTIPHQLQGVFTVKGPVVLDNELATSDYRTFDVNTIDQTQNQIWLEHDEYYYHEDIGCGVGIFCNNPRTKPAQTH